MKYTLEDLWNDKPIPKSLTDKAYELMGEDSIHKDDMPDFLPDYVMRILRNGPWSEPHKEILNLTDQYSIYKKALRNILAYALREQSRIDKELGHDGDSLQPIIDIVNRAGIKSSILRTNANNPQ